MGRKASPALIGAFVLGAIVLMIVGVVALGSGRFFRHTQPFVLFFPTSVNGLRVGAAVKFKGVEIGEVTRIMIRLQPRVLPGNDRIPVIIEVDQDRLSQRGANVSFTRDALDAAVARGFSGQLQPESFVTGVLYVELDFRPGAQRLLVGDEDIPYPEIPTVPTALEEVQMKVVEVINKIAAIDVDPLLASATAALDAVRTLAAAPGLRAAIDSLDPTLHSVGAAAASIRGLADEVDHQIGPLAKSFSGAADQANGTFGNVRTLVAPDSPLAYQLSHTLNDLSEAARALRALATELERNPSVLVRGRAPAGTP